MPHLTLEYTNNITQRVDAHDLFSKLHSILTEVAEINIENCKSRVIALDQFYMGDGSATNAFVHLRIALFEGRPLVLKEIIGKQCLHTLEVYFAPAIAEMHIQLTVEIEDINKQSYFKVSG
jgi:5-carboxymethyl-2-hydroxymuconate isomerase